MTDAPQPTTPEPWHLNRNIPVITLTAFVVQTIIFVGVVGMWKGSTDTKIIEIDTRTSSLSDVRMKGLELRTGNLEGRPMAAVNAESRIATLAALVAASEGRFDKIDKSITALGVKIDRALYRNSFNIPKRFEDNPEQ